MANTDDNIGRRIGDRLRVLRKAADLTQPQLAERVGGMEPETISRYERGVRVPTLVVLAELAQALGSDLDGFLADLIAFEPVERVELREIHDLLEPLGDDHLRAVRKLLAAHLDAIDIAMRRRRGGSARTPRRP